MNVCIVSSHYNEDVSWLYESPFPVFLISKKEEFKFDSKKFLKVHQIKNRGSEFGSYLWFICNYWDSLPEKIAFIHGHKTSHHQNLDIFESINLFKNLDFHGLNGPRVISYHYFFDKIPAHTWFPIPSNTWNYFGLNKLLPMPRQFVVQGGTQTIISKDLIKSNPLSFYKDLLDKIMLLSLYESWFAGLFFEIVWPTIFQQNPVNPELIDSEINNFCISKKVPIVLLGDSKVYGSHFDYTIGFEKIIDQNIWMQKCKQVLFNKSLWNKDVIA